MTDPVTLRMATDDDREPLAGLYAEAWRYAYRGIIPGLTLERMIARRGPGWWAPGRGRRDALLVEFGGRIVGYALFGACRIGRNRQMGEIAELYVRPECHGAGFGRRLFDEARRRLGERGFSGLLVWALAENDLACGFYRAMGGQRRFATVERLGEARLAKVGFHWA